MVDILRSIKGYFNNCFIGFIGSTRPEGARSPLMQSRTTLPVLERRCGPGSESRRDESKGVAVELKTKGFSPWMQRVARPQAVLKQDKGPRALARGVSSLHNSAFEKAGRNKGFELDGGFSIMDKILKS